VLLERNKRHYQQAAVEGTTPTTIAFAPFTQNHGTGSAAKELLEGKYSQEFTALPDVMQSWLRLVKTNANEFPSTPVTGEITREQFQAAFKAVSEATSSSPSGIHYTFWKAIARDDELSDYFSTMMGLPFQHGFVCKRWTTNIEVMLEKKPGVRAIHKLRIIGLLEADFNTALKILFSKQVMANAESIGISPEQNGGRSNRCSLDAALGKRLILDFALATFYTLALFMNDTVACFNE